MTVKEQLQELTQKVDKMQAMIEVLLTSNGEQSPPPKSIPLGSILWGSHFDGHSFLTGTPPSNGSFIGGGSTNSISAPNFPESDQ